MSPSNLSRERIAERIHDLLDDEIGHGIAVERLLKDQVYARDVLLVCDACVGSELTSLAGMFREASGDEPPPRPLPGGHQRQGNEWSGHTSGFGYSEPLGWSPSGPRSGPQDDLEAQPERRRAWLGRMRRG